MTLNDFADLGSVIGIFLVALGLYFSVQQFKLNRTMQYMEYLSKPEIVEVRAAVDEWLASSTDNDARINLLKNDCKLHSQVRVFVSFCNQVSTAYRFGAIFREMAFHIWFPFIPNYWKKLEFYMTWRSSQGYEVGGDFERFAKEIEDHHVRRKPSVWRRLRTIGGAAIHKAIRL
ncbi:MAG: hypothetical protein KME27_12970 [Lyngbya sp. HA4199-MV5]|jgi:hypothetical protein|nr:hypothetical protein [Lyngbya sp. HA4199-MV5]